MSGLTIEIAGPDALAGLRPEWEALWNATPDASPFQHPAWLLSWAEVYARDRCRAAVLRRDGMLAAIIPAFVWDGALLLAGTGPSDHSSALFGPGSEDPADDLRDALVKAFGGGFDRIDLQQLPTRSPLAAKATRPGEPCLVLPLDGEEGMANVPGRMRSNWRYAVRRLEREGAVIDLVDSAGADEAAELERLHGRRWRSEGEDGVLSDGLARRHLRLAIPELARAGLLRMHRLRRGSETIAILFAIRGKHSTSYYLSGFDPDCRHYSPGTALVGAAIAQAAREGASEFDFLRGQETYKYRWGAEDRPTARIIAEVRAPPVSWPAARETIS